MLENSKSQAPLRLLALPVGVSPLRDDPELSFSAEWCRRCVAGEIIFTSFRIDSPVSLKRVDRDMEPGVLGALGVEEADLAPNAFKRSCLTTVAVSKAAKQHFFSSATVTIRFSSSSASMEWSTTMSWTYSFSMQCFSLTGIWLGLADSERVVHAPETASSDAYVESDSRLQSSCSREISENFSASLSIVPFTLPIRYTVSTDALSSAICNV